MQALTTFVLAFAPGIFWLWLIYSRDKYHPEPRSLVIKAFIFGILIAIPVAIVETILGAPVLSETSTGAFTARQAAYGAFIVAGLVEALAKYIVVRRVVYNSPYFDEPMDGIIYTAAAALGFASIENVGYVFSFGWQVMLFRGWFSTLAHVFFPALWGYALARKKMRGGRGNLPVIVGLLAAILLHGIFNYFLLAPGEHQLYAFTLFAVAGIGFTGLIKRANRQSPYREKVSIPLIVCSVCGNENAYAANFCTDCGKRLSRDGSTDALLCSICRSRLQKDADFCTTCGSRINKKLT